MGRSNQNREEKTMKTVYLAGPMDFATDEQMTGWRKESYRFLGLDFEILDPVRRPHTCNLTDKEIFNLDMIDVRNSDILLVDCRDLGICSFGTPCEVFYAAYILNKPVIGWYDKETKPSGKGVFQNALIDRRFESLSEALTHILRFYK